MTMAIFISVFRCNSGFFLTLYFITFLSGPDQLYFYGFFSLKNVDPFDHCVVSLLTE